MDRAQHIARMRDTSAATVPLITRAYGELCEDSYAIAAPLDRFVRMRSARDQPLLRPYLVRLAYEAAGGQNWRAIASACAASEVLNISTYQANLAFDGKLGAVSQRDRSSQFACSMLSLALASTLLRAVKADPTTVADLQSDMLLVNSALYRGQLLDICVLTIPQLATTSDFSATYDLYYERCRLLGGALTRWCFTVGAKLAGAASDTLDILEQIGLLMGTAGQLLNDLGDFVEIPAGTVAVTNERYQGPFTDLATGKATLPLIVAFERRVDAVRTLAVRLAQGGCCKTDLRHCANLLHEAGCFEATKEEAKRIRRRVVALIRTLPPSIHSDYLALASSTLICNKYFTALRLQRSTTHA